MRVNDKIWFAGVDIETTGRNPATHGIIELAVDLDPRINPFHSFIYPGLAQYDPEAMKVNGKTRAEVGRYPHRSVVITKFKEFMEENGVLDGQIVPIGFNVGSFDMAFIRERLPEIAHYFSHRAVDLNSVVYTFDPLQAWNLKERLVTAAAAEMAMPPAFHTADYDADIAYRVWRRLRYFTRASALNTYLAGIEQDEAKRNPVAA